MSQQDEGRAGVPESAKLFNTTHWSIVRRAKDDSLTALNLLFMNYREPMIVHLLGKAYTHHDATELVQGFCVHLIRKDFLLNVAKAKGKFRSFLLTALNNYIRDQVEHARAVKRGEGRVLDSLDEEDFEGERLHSPAAAIAAADLQYDRAWAQAVLQNALKRLEEESATSGHTALCQALEPAFFADETSLSYRDIASRLEMSEGAVKTAAHRLKHRLRGLIREEIMQTVSDKADFDEELTYLISLFGRG